MMVPATGNPVTYLDLTMKQKAGTAIYKQWNGPHPCKYQSDGGTVPMRGERFISSSHLGFRATRVGEFFFSDT